MQVSFQAQVNEAIDVVRAVCAKENAFLSHQGHFTFVLDVLNDIGKMILLAPEDLPAKLPKALAEINAITYIWAALLDTEVYANPAQDPG